MTFTDITQIIANLGFPIAACIALYIMNTKTINKLTEAVEELKKLVERLYNGN